MNGENLSQDQRRQATGTSPAHFSMREGSPGWTLSLFYPRCCIQKEQLPTMSFPMSHDGATGHIDLCLGQPWYFPHARGSAGGLSGRVKPSGAVEPGGLTFISFCMRPVSGLWSVPSTAAPHLHVFTSMGSPCCIWTQEGGVREKTGSPAGC